MKSPSLYKIKKITLQDIIKADYNLFLHGDKLKEVLISQQYNQLFRIVLQETGNKTRYISEIVFVDCKNYRNYQYELETILEHGFKINNKKYVMLGKSASMGRNGIIGFIDEDLFEIVDERAMMGLNIGKTVLSKFEAYKHLLFSSCFCLEGDKPYMIVVDDYNRTVENVRIKYVEEKTGTYIKDGVEREWKEKIIKEGYKDISNDVADGSGICSVEIAKEWQEKLDIPYTPCVYMLRLPYVKGLSVVFDFKKYFREKEIFKIKDIWGQEHFIDDVDIILTKSQFKGIKYFKKDGSYNDWLDYLERLKKYNHCLGIAKWNYSHSNEPKMTKANYQILQTLDITSNDMIEMSSYTRRWIEKILSGDLMYIYNYLGLKGNPKASNNYMRAIMLNPKMVNDIKIRHYLYGLLEKTINEIKIGKIYIKGAFKILIPDIIMLVEFIGGLEPKGCLKEGEMFAKEHLGEYVLNRNPHICRSEHVILNAVKNDVTSKWLSHLENVCMVNGYDVTAKRLNGADFDGDLALCHNNPIFMKGIHNDLPIVLDIDDKITAIEKEYTRKNLVEFTMMSLDSRIGEISNCASSYHNKKALTPEKQTEYDDYTCLLSVINGKEIDLAKTGVRWNVPRKIAKNSRPLPYFLKYKYANLNKVSRSKSILNEHCWYIENWQKRLKFNYEFINTSECMINTDIPFDTEKFLDVARVYSEFKRESKRLKEQEKMSKNYDLYKEFWDGLNKFEVENTEIKWDRIYDKYRIKFQEIVPNQSELANYIIELVYNRDKGIHYIFAWQMVEEGILTNLRVNQTKPLMIPQETATGTEYLGRYYTLEEYEGVI